MHATSTNILIICVLCYTVIVTLYTSINLPNPWSSSRKRAAILERYATDPQTASFSSATSLGAASLARNHKRTVQLHEIVWGFLRPSEFNGTWVGDSDIMYKDDDGGITMLNLQNNFSYQVTGIHDLFKEYNLIDHSIIFLGIKLPVIYDVCYFIRT